MSGSQANSHPDRRTAKGIKWRGGQIFTFVCKLCSYMYRTSTNNPNAVLLDRLLHTGGTDADALRRFRNVMRTKRRASKMDKKLLPRATYK